MKSIKKITLGLVALVSLISVVFITASPNGVSAQTTRPADRAVVAITFDVDADAAAKGAVFTVDWTSTNCEAPIGGTLSQAAGGGSTLGPVPSDDRINSTSYLVTHFNGDTASGDGSAADPCQYALTITSSLDCDFSVDANAGADDDLLATTKNAGEVDPFVNAPKAVTIRLSGAPVSDNANFFTVPDAVEDDPETEDNDESMTAGAQQANGARTLYAGLASAVGLGRGSFATTGSLSKVLSRAGGVDTTTTQGTDVFAYGNALQGENPAEITAVIGDVDCAAPAVTGTSFSVTNAEPVGSLALQIQANPLNNCEPRFGVEGSAAFAEGEPATQVEVEIDSACNFDFSVGHSSTATIIPEINGVKSQCGVSAVLYLLDEDDISAFSDFEIISDVTDDVQLTFSRVGRAISHKVETVIGQITLFVSNDCPVLGQADFGFDTLDGTERVVAESPVTVTITPTANSAAGCVALPGVATIAGSSKLTTVNFIVRPRGARACVYEITYARAEGALSFVAEVAAADIAVDDGNTPDVNERVDSYTTDGKNDATIVVNALALSGRTTPIRFTYTQRQVPISVTMNFPNNAVFTTNDRVDFRIQIIGECARFGSIIVRVLGETGTYRSLQAYPGTTIVFDKQLEALESSNNKDGELLYEVDPIVVINDETFSCSVEVVEESTPAGCTVIGGDIQTLTFSEGLGEFEFRFDHTCTGAVVSGGRGLTA